jgi:hypothetical protein
LSTILFQTLDFHCGIHDFVFLASKNSHSSLNLTLNVQIFDDLPIWKPFFVHSTSFRTISIIFEICLQHIHKFVIILFFSPHEIEKKIMTNKVYFQNKFFIQLTLKVTFLVEANLIKNCSL